MESQRVGHNWVTELNWTALLTMPKALTVWITINCGKFWKRVTEWLHFNFFHFHALEKEMATHSSVLAWRIPGTGSLVGCHLWGRAESDTTKTMQQQQLQRSILLVLLFLITHFEVQQLPPSWVGSSSSRLIDMIVGHLGSYLPTCSILFAVPLFCRIYL